MPIDGRPEQWHWVDTDGVHMQNPWRELTIPFGEIISIRRVNLFWSIVLGWNLLKPGISERYMDPAGDPLRLVLLETKTGRYLLRGFDMDEFVLQVRNRMPAYKASVLE